jgi:ATP-dependent DNA helicase RecG
MTPDEIKNKIMLGEDTRTEFKDERASPDAIAAAIVSFANTAEGGNILMGVADDGTVTGISKPDALLQQFDNLCKNNIEPSIGVGEISAEKIWVDNAIVIVIHVRRGRRRPYRTNKGDYYIRGLAGKHKANPQELLEIFQSEEALAPDKMAIEDANRNDINDAYFFGLRPELQSLSESSLRQSLINMKVLSESGQLTLGGLLCYGRDPQRFRDYARITAILHSGNEISEEFKDRKEIGGTLAQQIEGTYAFVRNNFPKVVGTPSLYPPPFQAIEEAIVNAVAHRDYFALAQIRIFIFNNRIEVISPGRLLNKVTIEAIREGYHLMRNPVIFNHLTRLRLATQAGHGIPTMLRTMRASYLPEPEFRIVGHEFRVLFHLTGVPQ